MRRTSDDAVLGLEGADTQHKFRTNINRQSMTLPPVALLAASVTLPHPPALEVALPILPSKPNPLPALRHLRFTYLVNGSIGHNQHNDERLHAPFFGTFF